MEKVVVSIVIVNYNGKDLLKTILNSISKINNKQNYEIIVVDNDSKDGSQEFIKKTYKNIRLVENKKNLGYSGINSALPYCKGRYILFLNNDMEIDRNCIKELLSAIEKDKTIGMAAPMLVNYYNKGLKSGGTWVSRAFYNGHIRGNGSPEIKEIPYLGVGLIRKDLAEKFGYLFDNDYFIYAEDLDLGLRLRLLGFKVVFVPDAVLRHMHAVTTKKSKSYEMAFLMERNLMMTYFKILSFKNIILLMPYVFLMRIAAIAKDIITLKFMNALARISAIFWIILNFNLVAKKRKRLQELRKADDDFLFRVFSEKYLFKPKFIV